MTPKEELEEIPCPACNGKGVFVARDDMENVEDWQVCRRCQGTGTILVRIKHQYAEEE